MINLHYYYSNFDFILIYGLFSSTFLSFQIMILLAILLFSIYSLISL